MPKFKENCELYEQVYETKLTKKEKENLKTLTKMQNEMSKLIKNIYGETNA